MHVVMNTNANKTTLRFSSLKCLGDVLARTGHHLQALERYVEATEMDVTGVS